METLGNKTCYAVKFSKHQDMQENTYKRFKNKCWEVLDEGDEQHIYTFEAEDNEYLFLCWDELKNRAILEFFQEEKLLSDYGILSKELFGSGFFSCQDSIDLTLAASGISMENEASSFDKEFSHMMKQYL